MNICPTCKEGYDEEITFCLTDGSRLKKTSRGRFEKGGINKWLAIVRSLQIIAFIGLAVSLGSFVACVGSGVVNQSYGQEQEYAPGKMGASSFSSNEDQEKFLAFVSLGGAAIFILVGFGSLVLKESVSSAAEKRRGW